MIHVTGHPDVIGRAHERFIAAISHVGCAASNVVDAVATAHGSPHGAMTHT